MKEAWKVIEQLIESNAQHRKGFKLQEVSPVFVLSQAQEELDELKREPSDPGEMADLLGVLFHYAIKQGWTMRQLEYHLLDKLRIRFANPKEKDHGTTGNQ